MGRFGGFGAFFILSVEQWDGCSGFHRDPLLFSGLVFVGGSDGYLPIPAFLLFPMQRHLCSITSYLLNVFWGCWSLLTSQGSLFHPNPMPPAQLDFGAELWMGQGEIPKKEEMFV